MSKPAHKIGDRVFVRFGHEAYAVVSEVVRLQDAVFYKLRFDNGRSAFITLPENA